MPYYRQSEVTAVPYTGDTRKQAVLDIDSDLTAAFDVETKTSATLEGKLAKSTIGTANGPCALDGDGKVKLDNIDTVPFSALPASTSYPVGSIIIYPVNIAYGSSVPINDWIECDGRVLSKSAYPTLFDTIGYRFGGSGDSFYAPDLRGRFVRGWDHGSARDLNAADRSNSGDGTTGNHVGTLQDQSFLNHSHVWYYQDSWQGQGGVDLYFSWDNQKDDITTNAGGNESRPANIYVAYIMRIQ